MRWFPSWPGKKQVQNDPGQQQALLNEVRQRFGTHVRVPFREQADQITGLLVGDDGLCVAAEILRECAEAANAQIVAQAAELQRRTGNALTVNRRNYRPLWRAAGQYLHWPLFELSGGLFPYVHASAAATVIASQARRSAQVTPAVPLLAQVLEILDLTVIGWEYARVRMDVNTARLADQLIVAAQQIRAEMSNPPPLPPPVRELMRRDNTIEVYNSAGDRIVGAFNPGERMRETLLL